MSDTVGDKVPAKFDAFAILSLPPPRTLNGATLTTGQIKTAYRKALLQYHPDKISTESSRNHATPATQRTGAATVDDIALARDILLSPSRRAAHEVQLRIRKSDEGSKAHFNPSTEYEIVDLDDLHYNEYAAEGPVWTRSCRCGDPIGFQITEADLEEALAGGSSTESQQTSSGELLVCCNGCSLMLRVGFSAV